MKIRNALLVSALLLAHVAWAQSKTSEFVAYSRGVYATEKYSQYTNTVVTRWSDAGPKEVNVPISSYSSVSCTLDFAQSGLDHCSSRSENFV